MRCCLSALAFALGLALAACSSTSGLDLPLVGREQAFVPVEGLERTDLGQGACGALLSGRGEKPIEIRRWPSGRRSEHPIRGHIVALAGPAPDGAFVYAVRDERRDLAVHRASLDGRDEFVARFERPIHALALAPDGERVAILSPFPDEDARSRGGSLRELVLLDLRGAASTETGAAIFPATPAWIDAESLACVTIAADGRGALAVFDLGAQSIAPSLGAGDRVLAAPGGAELIAFERVDGDLTARRVGLDGTVRGDTTVRGVIEPLAALGNGLVIAFSRPTLGAEPQWELDLFAPQVALATIKLHDLATGEFQTVETRASPRRLWSAGRLSEP